MPSMLGLTTDPSPHGLNATGDVTGAVKGSASGALTLGKQNDNNDPNDNDAHYDDQDQQNQKQNQEDEQDDEPKKKTNNIHNRNIADGKKADVLFWGAMCDDPESATDYIAEDCTMVSALLPGHENEPLVGKKEISKALKDLPAFTGFRVGHDAHVVEVGMMAVSTLYRVTLSTKDGGQVEAVVNSAWRETAGAEWELCGQLIAYAH